MATLCKIRKDDRTSDLKTIIKMTNAPKSICKRCLRVANKKKYLCEPVSM